jgi:hypothetical protein
MRLRNRFLLVGLGVVLFVATTPFLVLYARGFKIDWENRQFVKTGALVVKTEPTKAEIYINDEKHESLTPANVRFILPGDYNIRLEKENYQSWTKRLTIKSQLVTWANSNREYIALFLSTPQKQKTWLGTEISLGADNLIYFREGGLLKKLNPENTDTQSIESVPVNALETKDQINKILLDLNITPPEFTKGELIRTSNQIYLILDGTLYVANDGLEKIYSPVIHTNWNDKSKQLLFSNDNEIYTYYAEWNDWDLILRSLTTINKPILNSETGFIFFQNESKIKAIELDGRGHRNIFTIADAMDEFSVSDDGKKLYTLSQNEIKYYIIR